MQAARSKTRPRSEVRLMAAIAHGKLTEVRHLRFQDLLSVLQSGDVVVVNDAATVPASLQGIHLRTGVPIEMRLVSLLSENLKEPTKWRVVFFGSGNWRTRTEDRAAPPPFNEGDLLQFDAGLIARVERVSPEFGRQAEICFEAEGQSLWQKLYSAGHPIQYSHLQEDLELWDVQTVFSGPPVSLEPPSAALPLSWGLVLNLRQAGISVVSLTHAASISTTGDARLDQQMPFPERYTIPIETAETVNQARAERRRVIAVGTTVVRALESAADEGGRVKAGSGIATLKMTPKYRRRVVSGIFSGFHDQGASHLELLGSFVPPALLLDAYRDAENRGYLSHEFGDSCLLIATEDDAD